MTDALLQEKKDLEETWMRGAMLNRLGAVSFAFSWKPPIGLTSFLSSRP